MIRRPPRSPLFPSPPLSRSLQSIMGFAELGALRSRGNPAMADMFNDIHEAGIRMLALVNDLLDVAKLESAVGTIHVERTDLRSLIRPVVRELEPQQQQKLIDLRSEEHTSELQSPCNLV